MSRDTQITTAGNLTNDPEIRVTNNGTTVCNFTIAVNQTRKENDEWVDNGTTFYKVTAFDGGPNSKLKLATNCHKALTKGMRAQVTGTLETDTWTNKEGEEKLTLCITANDAGPSLKWAAHTGRDKTAEKAHNERPFTAEEPF